MKKSYLLILFIAFTGLIGCQKDIKVLGEGDSAPKTKVYINTITLRNFPENDPNTMLSWDDGAVQPFDTLDYTGPDIYFNLYYYNPDNELLPLSFHQTTHFSNILPLHTDTPLVYYIIPPFQILPEYIDTTFYLTMLDLDFVGPDTTSIYMDSIPFTVGHDFNVTSIDNFGFNGSHVTLGLEWK